MNERKKNLNEFLRGIYNKKKNENLLKKNHLVINKNMMFIKKSNDSISNFKISNSFDYFQKNNLRNYDNFIYNDNNNLKNNGKYLAKSFQTIKVINLDNLKKNSIKKKVIEPNLKLNNSIKVRKIFFPSINIENKKKNVLYQRDINLKIKNIVKVISNQRKRSKSNILPIIINKKRFNFIN
jgi:hypothetical protein